MADACYNLNLLNFLMLCAYPPINILFSSRTCLVFASGQQRFIKKPAQNLCVEAERQNLIFFSCFLPLLAVDCMLSTSSCGRNKSRQCRVCQGGGEGDGPKASGRGRQAGRAG